MTDNKVWDILTKEKWTPIGITEFERLNDAIVRIFEKANINDLRIMYEGIDYNLFETMDILKYYLKLNSK